MSRRGDGARLAPQGTEGIRRSLKGLIKETIWLTTSYAQGPAQNICIFGTRRGGSTWLMEVIGANRGMRALDQPLELLTPNLTANHYRRLPKFDQGQLITLADDQEPEVLAFVGELLDGRFPANAPYRFWQRDFDFRASRLVLKVMDAKPLMDWFDQHWPLQIVYLVRHPIPQALSCLRNGWPSTAQAFLRNPWFRDELLGPELNRRAESVLAGDDELLKAVLNWILENLYPLRAAPARSAWIKLGYEDCIADTDGMVEALAERLGLQDRRAMLRAVQRQSRSAGHSRLETLGAIRHRDTEVLLTSWKKYVTAEQEKRCYELLADFDVGLYHAESVFPDWQGYGDGYWTRRDGGEDGR